MPRSDGIAATIDFPGSRAHFDRARRILPRGVTSAARADVTPAPLVIREARGSRVWDVDGREYLDLVCGFGPGLLGHNPEILADAVSDQLTRGANFGAQHVGELRLAELVCQFVPSAEVVSLCNSGTEAVQAALRIARARTGRQKIIRFNGHYHGWIDPVAVPGDPGSSRASGSDAISIRWNDPLEFARVMKEHGSEVAAVIMEAIPCNQGVFTPKPGYLDIVRRICDDTGALLIFDEVITGFRLAPGGAQSILGVTPDIVVLAKAMAGGYPMAAVAGKRDTMSVAMEGGALKLMGTYNGHALGVAASVAMLEYIAEQGPALYGRLEETAAALKAAIEDAARSTGTPLTVNRYGSVFQLYWGLDAAPTSFEEMAGSDRAGVAAVAHALLARGVYLLPRGLLFVSAAHTSEDIRQAGEAFRDALAAIAETAVNISGKD